MEKTFYAAVLGSPIAHSKSPTMHRAVYQHLGLPIKYDRIEVTQDQVDEFMHTLTDRYSSIEQLAGFSVTMPLKGALVPHMDSLSDRVKLLGVLNTVVFDDTGRAQGYNTDVDGIRLALTHAGFTSSVGGTMGILGAGGTATAAVAAAAEMQVDAIDFYVRNPARAAATRAVAERLGLTVDIKALEDFTHEAPNHQAIVSTLPAYAADSFAANIPQTSLPPLLDVIYEPWPTALAAAWQATGSPVASGLHMLLYQGVEQAKLFTQRLTDHQTIDWQKATAHMAASLGLSHF
jgi:shikimate dehydrogenase